MRASSTSRYSACHASGVTSWRTHPVLVASDHCRCGLFSWIAPSMLTSAELGTEAIPGTMEEALANNPAAVVAAHTAVKAMTDDLKSRFVNVLNLRVPDEGAGDND